jgi:hypothetical protein
MISTELALLFFNAVNCIRLIAYVPQIVTILRCPHGAQGVSCLSWSLFAVGHLATALYGWVTAHDVWMAFVFMVNFSACTLIIVLALYKRAEVRRAALIAAE